MVLDARPGGDLLGQESLPVLEELIGDVLFIVIAMCNGANFCLG
jgi:hypothetical protein